MGKTKYNHSVGIHEKLYSLIIFQYNINYGDKIQEI